jgi:hypothetical protein
LRTRSAGADHRRWFGELNAPGGVILPEFYNQLVAMHGTIMVFLAVVPLSVGAFGNYLIPLQIGAPDMAFPRLNMASYWTYLAGGVVMLASFFVAAALPIPVGRHIRRSLISRPWGRRSGWRDVPADRVGDLWLRQHHHDHRAAARARTDVVPPAVLRVGATRHRVSCCCWRFLHCRAPRSCSSRIGCSAQASSFRRDCYLRPLRRFAHLLLVPEGHGTDDERGARLDSFRRVVQMFWFTPTKTGEWEIACSQLCGLGHYRMRGFYTIQTQADFDAWLKSQPAGL